MANDLKSAGNKAVVAEVIRYGEKLTIPEGMKLREAAELIHRRMEYEEQETIVQATFDCFPWDGACALERVLSEKYGWAQGVPTPGFFGASPPAMIEVEVGFNQVRKVMWGRFALPKVEGFLQTGMAQGPNGRVQFQVSAKVKRKDEATIEALYAGIRAEVKANSIYRGKAIRIDFLDDDGNPIELPMPKFLDTDSVRPEMLILSKHLEDAVNTNLFTPIERCRDCLANGIPVKRGVLLGGTFGTGKTMIAHVASKVAVDAGVTFLYVKRTAEMARGIEFLRQYQSPAGALFVEDIDREMAGDRSVEMDEILNTIDGIDSKSSNIIVVLTTNAIEKIHQAMLRPGRIDAVLNITAPDAEAVERLIRGYGGNAIDADMDLAPVGKVLGGNIPAVIAEVVKRAKLSQLARQAKGTQVTKLSVDALLESAMTIQAQVDLLKPKAVDERPQLEQALASVVKEAFNGNSEAIHDTQAKVSKLHSGLRHALK